MKGESGSWTMLRAMEAGEMAGFRRGSQEALLAGGWVRGIKADPGLGVVFMRTRKAQRRAGLNWGECRVPFGHGDLRGLLN